MQNSVEESCLRLRTKSQKHCSEIKWG